MKLQKASICRPAPRILSPLCMEVRARGVCSTSGSRSGSVTTAAAGIGMAPIRELRGGSRRVQTNVTGRRESVFFFGFGGNNDDDDDDEPYTVCKLQIGLFGDINKWQSKLDGIANKYDTADEEGLHGVYTDALMMVLRNTEYAGYATSGGKVYESLDEAEQKFNTVLMEERVKFKEETLVNVDGRRKTRTLDVKGAGDTGLDRWLCMTLLMAIDGKIKIPKISSPWDLKQVLTTLGGISADRLVAFELLWTPQETDDSYSKQELLEDYPSMIPLA